MSWTVVRRSALRTLSLQFALAAKRGRNDGYETYAMPCSDRVDACNPFVLSPQSVGVMMDCVNQRGADRARLFRRWAAGHYRRIGRRVSVRDTHSACNSDLTGICNELHNPGGRSSTSVVLSYCDAKLWVERAASVEVRYEIR